jgi:predicted GIY-YIG superfamily endonuclease
MTRTVADAVSIYVLRCGDGSLYTGTARDVEARVRKHQEGKGAKYTRGRGPIVLLASRPCPSKGDALRVEWALKQLSKDAKERLVKSPRALASFVRRQLSPKVENVG